MEVGIVSGTMDSPETAVETNAQGCYQIGSVPPGTFKVAVYDKEGNRIALGSIVVGSEDISTLNFVIHVDDIPEERIPVVELFRNQRQLKDKPAKRFPLY